MTPLTRSSTIYCLVLVASALFWRVIVAQSVPAPPLLISEFLAINDRVIADEDGAYSDWIEVHNPGPDTIDLDGWSLTDDMARPRKWTFPAIALQAGRRLIVFASGKDRVDASSQIHASFKLDGDGEDLALIDPEGRVSDAYSPYPPQRANVSYGVAPGDGARRYFDTPTPGWRNDPGGVDGLVADTRFSLDRGFYDEPILVEITTETPDAMIRYTRDGKEPSEHHGEIYAAPILVDHTTIIRAAAFRADLAPTGVDTQTYIFLDDVITQDHQQTLDAGFPERWGETLPDYGMDADVIGPDGRDRFGGKYAATIKSDLQSVASLSIVMDIDDLFGEDGIYTHAVERGVEWERPASVELIRPDGRPGFEVSCGIRIHGGAFRNHVLTKKHSFRLLFKDIYGPTKLRYPWFGEGATDRFDSIVLRAGSNDGWQWDGAGSRPLYIRDSFARATLLAMGGVASHGSFVHVYLNGIYWGLYNAVERPDASFSATYHGGDKDDWDAISSGSPADGTLDAWNRMVEMASAGLEDNASYQRIQGKRPDGTDDVSLDAYLDMQSLADYMIVNLYVGNTDWPRKNYWVARNRRADAPLEASRRGFQFYPWDTEWSIGIRSDLNTNRIAVKEGVAAAWPYVKENAEFRVLFGDRVHRHFRRGGALYVAEPRPVWDTQRPGENEPAARFKQLCDLIDRAIVPESARWGDQHRSPAYTRDEHWQRERDDLLVNYFPHRSAVVLAQLSSSGLYPTLAAPELTPRDTTFVTELAVRMAASDGRIYYTLDGTDPRLAGGAISPRAVEIGVAEEHLALPDGADALVFVPRDGSLALDWTRLDYDDTGWDPGQTGVGYERTAGFETLIRTDVETRLYGRGSSIYLRLPFTLEDPGHALPILSMRYDDGFIAYLNGQRVAASNAPDDARWDSVAIERRADALAWTVEEFDLSQYADLLRPGLNVLAIHGLNRDRTSSDLLVLPQLALRERLEPRGPTIGETTVVKARAWTGGTWSALTEAVFVDTSLRITELMYHPPEPAAPEDGAAPYAADDYEFIELENIGGLTIDLAGIRLTGAIEFDFSDGGISHLAPGELVLVVKDLGAFESYYATSDLLIAGEYRGNLSNAGEALRLEGPHGTTILSFSYDDAWYPATDGGGHSLVVVEPEGAPDTWGEVSSWMESNHMAGSPGGHDDEAPALAGWQLIGDANQDGQLDISDVIALMKGLFGPGLSGNLPCDPEANLDGNLIVLDWNGDRVVDLSDAVSMLRALFSPGAEHAECVRIEGCASVCAP